MQKSGARQGLQTRLSHNSEGGMVRRGAGCDGSGGGGGGGTVLVWALVAFERVV